MNAGIGGNEEREKQVEKGQCMDREGEGSKRERSARRRKGRVRIIGKDRIIEKGNSLEGGKGEVRVLLSNPLFLRNNTTRSNEARKVNCSCVFSAYILKLHFSLGGVCKQE